MEDIAASYYSHFAEQTGRADFGDKQGTGTAYNEPIGKGIDMTDMEKKVMVRLCAKIVADTDLYETDKEVQNLIDWVCLSEQIKENNNTIRNLTGEYKKIEPDCREGVRAQLERMKELCKERNNLYEKQNDLKRQKWKIEKSLER